MYQLIKAITGVLLLTGCVGYDFQDIEKDPSYALPLSQTAASKVGALAAPQIDAHPGQSAFYFQHDGVDALASRILMAERAEQSIDAQYYLFSPDDTSRALIGAMLAAADRGVRVRLLLDDIFTKGYDTWMLALDSHPNFEVRLFNPFLRRQSRWVDGLVGFKRINRRMHNKSFTVDNKFTIIGGRNVGSEYFAANEDMNFGDLDVAAFGPVVQDVSSMFDQYWNNDLAVPVSEIAKPLDDPAAALGQVRTRISQALAKLTTSQYGDALSANMQGLFDVTADELIWADYELVFDQPELGRTDAQAKGADTIVYKLAESVNNAQNELIIVSPYFVPTKTLLARIRDLRDKEVKVTILTNSLASTNHHVVHSGYYPSRKKLLKMGVEIWEQKPDARILGTEQSDRQDSVSGLHTKAFLVDRQELYLGSFNFDPRSVNINTELGVIIKSAEAGTIMGDRADILLPKLAYQVILTEQGNVAWIDNSGDKPVIYTKDPQTSWGTRFKVGLMRLLPVNGQL